MQTKQIIQSSANVIRITTLAKGNLYKRMKKEYGDTYKPLYGIVTDIMNDGENTFIEVMEYEKSYSSTSSEIRIIAGGKETLRQKEKLYVVAQKFIEGEMKKTLTEASYEEISQSQYEQQKQPIPLQ